MPPIFYPVKLQHSSYKHVLTSRMENSVNHDKMASTSGSTAFSKKDKSEISWTRVKIL